MINKKIVKEKLEVLEILRKKRVNLDYLIDLYNWYVYHGYNRCIEYTLEKYNNDFFDLPITRQLTKKELIKIISWLEYNKFYEE